MADSLSCPKCGRDGFDQDAVVSDGRVVWRCSGCGHERDQGDRVHPLPVGQRVRHYGMRDLNYWQHADGVATVREVRPYRDGTHEYLVKVDPEGYNFTWPSAGKETWWAGWVTIPCLGRAEADPAPGSLEELELRPLYREWLQTNGQ